MERHTIKQQLSQRLFDKTSIRDYFKMDNLTVIKRYDNTFIVSDKNNVITYDFKQSIDDNLKRLDEMDENGNEFCQDCINVKDSYGLTKERNKTNVKRITIYELR